MARNAGSAIKGMRPPRVLVSCADRVKMNVDESLIEEDNRIPRFTSATWKYENGALGHLEHGVALQGTEFSTEFTVCKYFL
jgi:hypothetical protein